tara:strand:- start:7998 stop:8630 length:633 start_codon:yes stop_codon:yes gene_type:complete
MALGQYYNRDRGMLQNWMQSKQAAAQGWANTLGNIATMGILEMGKGRDAKLSQGYEEYSAKEIEEGREPMTSESWADLHGKSYLKGLRKEARETRKAERKQGIKNKGLLGIAQRLLPGGASGYAPVRSNFVTPLNPPANVNIQSGMTGPYTNLPPYSGPSLTASQQPVNAIQSPVTPVNPNTFTGYTPASPSTGNINPQVYRILQQQGVI